MIHVPDVRAAADWYQTIGFTLLETVEDDGVPNWADLSFGRDRVMLSAGGHANSGQRRDVDLYVYVDDVEELYRRLKDRVEVGEHLIDTFYGHRTFVVRDLNGFWITFAQELTGTEAPRGTIA
jgi:uncharacterized glyoxalase superfamily protein PhnB